MSSETEICNFALAELSQEEILNLQVDSSAANLCNLRYGSIRDAVMRAYPWNCCIERATLVQDATPPGYDYDYRYVLPTDPYCLRVLELKEKDSGYPWEIEGKYLVTDSTTATIRYIARVEDPVQWDTLLSETVAARLASAIAYPITGSRKMEETKFQLYKLKLREARSIDAQETGRAKVVRSNWLNARRGG